MENSNVTIAIDAMGGDNSPSKILKGIELFLKIRSDVNLVLFGDKNKIQKSIINNNFNLFNYEIVNTQENIQNDDTPSIILRNRKDSSITKGLEYIKDVNSSGFVSAGNTAAIMIMSKLKLGMLEGIDRPAICAIIPNNKNYSIMLDLGANVTSDAKSLLQFAIMGNCYHAIFKPNIEPKLGIVNIGTEQNKGKDYLQEAMDLINNSFLKKNFIGFIEPNKITSGDCDIMITDGYTGNIILKTASGMSNYITGNLRKMFTSSIKNKIAYKMIEKDLDSLKDNVNPDKYNGAIFIGVNGISIKSHGSANPTAFSFAIDRCYKFIKNDINSKIRFELGKI